MASDRRLYSTTFLNRVSLLAAVLGALPMNALANPQGGVVSAGQASIAQSGNTLSVTQQSNKAVIDWRGFDIAPDETTQFIQPSSNSIALNRVNSTSASHIDGTLTANGDIVIINQNGVMFGGTAKVDVNGLIATTADISNDAFMNSTGKLSFNTPGNPNAAIVNNGTITAAQAGLVGFVAPNVINNGVITAKLGKVQLASGDTATVDMYGDGLMEVAVSNQVTSQLVSNSGTIQADGGKIALTAAAGSQIVNSLITSSGTLRAQRIAQNNGTITIYAEGSNAVQNNVAANKGQKSGTSEVLVSGTIDASGYAPGETGGTIETMADNVGLLSGALLDASGDAGGGAIFVGGNYHGVGPTPTALNTIVQSGTLIEANAVTDGSGGNVAVWSDNYTNFAGLIEARGGANGGNGGYVETSGKINLQMSGLVDASAPNGQAGSWLMDPEDVTISTGGDSDESGNPSFVPGGTQATAVINTSDIDTALNAGTNVTITTSNNAQSGPNGGSITVANAISATGGGTALSTTGSLTLSSYKDITINSGASITLGGGTNLSSATVKGGAVTLDASNSGNNIGAISIAANITTNGGDITMGGNEATPSSIVAGTGYAVGDASIGNNVYGGKTGVYINNVTVSSRAGNIIINGQGYNSGSQNAGVEVSSASGELATTSGNITVNGIGGAGSGNDQGVLVDHSGIITTASGTITLTGTGSIGGYGFNTDHSATISSTGSGTITITGITGAGSGGISPGGSTGTTNIGGALDTGNITLIADSFNFTQTNSIQTTGTVVFAPRTASTTIGVNGGSGTLQLTSAILGSVSSESGITIGGGTGYSGNIAITDYSWVVPITYANGSGNVTVTNAGAMTVGQNLATTGTGTLTLEAASDITVSHTIITQGGAIILDADTVGSGGAISVSSNVTSNGGNITMGGNEATPSNIVAGTGYAVGDANVVNHYSGYSGIYINGATVNAGVGSIIANGHGYNNTGSGVNTGVFVYGSGVLQTTSGNITINGIGGTIGNAQFDGEGVILDTSGQITTTSGNISVTGVASSGSGGSLIGIFIGRNSVIQATGNGNVTLVGTGGAGSNYDSGIQVSLTGTIGSGGSGTINLAGIAGSGGGSSYGIENYTSGGASTLTVGGASASGNIILAADTLALRATTTIQTTGNVTFVPHTASTLIGVAGGTGTLQITGGAGSILAGTNAGSITIGRTDGTGNIDVGAETLGANTIIQSSSGNITFDGIQTLGTKTLTAATASGNIIIDQGDKIVSTASSGNSIVLAAGGNFTNNDSNDGSGTLVAGTGTARYLVYSTNPSLNTMNGLSDAGDHIFNKTYAGYSPGSVTQTGNLFLYSLSPTITVTANNASRLYGAADPSFTASYSGFVDSDTSAIFSGSPSLTTPGGDTATSAAGNTYTITAAIGSLAQSLGYQLSYTNGTLTVNKAHLTVTANNASRVYGAADPSFTDTLSGFVNGENSSVVSGSASLTTPGGDTATSAAGSTYAITAAQGSLSASNYDFTAFNNGMLTVNKAHLTVTANNQNMIYGAGSLPTLTDAISGYVNGENATTANVTGSPTLSTTATAYNGTAGSGSNVGGYTITAAAGNLSAANYDFTYANGLLTVIKVALAVTADNQHMTAGGTEPALTYS